MDEKPFQFSLSRLLWGFVLIGFWLACVHHSLTVDIRQIPEPFWGVVATPPVAGGLIGLFQNGTKGMLIGIAIGVGVLVVGAFCLP